ncbi:MAG: T9SS type A sorting domain-containing protein, partial [Chitinophagales bacterium]|nr:T9SS type A sorting domain-containing protein [Chitinophagales bacterium]
FPQVSVRTQEYHLIQYSTDGNSGCDPELSIIENELYHIGKYREEDCNEWNNISDDKNYLQLFTYMSTFLPDKYNFNKQVFTANILHEASACTDSLFFSFELYDTSGICISLPPGFTCVWQSVALEDMITDPNALINIEDIHSTTTEGEKDFFISLTIRNSENHIIAFDILPVQVPVYDTIAYLIEYGINSNTISIIHYNTDTLAQLYTWDMGDGTIYTNMLPAEHRYSLSGIYTITYTVWTDTANNCFYTTTENIEISGPVLLAPNPARNIVTLYLNENYRGNIMLYDMNRKLLFEQVIDETSSAQIMNIGFLPAGMYIITALTQEKIFIEKLVIN